ncbi:hypothetical protein B0H14DRAFT_3174751 [Mycena olivaceomarginata]|nr:hypothetical protein B0H14DRAFT_3174751 [Mycena olivaceomarginata]
MDWICCPAGRLSVALQLFLRVTQLQLLGHMTFVELEARVHRQAEEMTPDHTFMHMQSQERFSTTLWAIQTTPETSLDSVATTVKYYVEQIKLAHPSGFYRIGGFSANSLLTFEVARLLESEGKTIAQLAMLDHYPTLFAFPILPARRSLSRFWTTQHGSYQGCGSIDLRVLFGR